MKTNNFMSLIQEADTLNEKELSAIVGGRSCGCACYYRNVGGSCTDDNMEANYAGGSTGLESPQNKAYQIRKVDFEDGPQIFGRG